MTVTMVTVLTAYTPSDQTGVDKAMIKETLEGIGSISAQDQRLRQAVVG